MGLFLFGAITAGLFLTLTAPRFLVNPIDYQIENVYEVQDGGSQGGPLQNEKQSEKREVCTKAECTNIAQIYLSNLDTTADPCKDFYKFACGNYANRNPIPADKTAVSAQSELTDLLEAQLREVLEGEVLPTEPNHFQNLKKYYRSCIDVVRINRIGLSEVGKIMDGLGGWPLVDGKGGDVDWQRSLYAVHGIGLDAKYLLELFADFDYVNSSVRLFSVSTPHFKLDQTYLRKGRDDKIVGTYYRFLLGIARLFGADNGTVEKDVGEILDFEIALVQASKSLEEIRADIASLYNVYTIEQLESSFPDFPWFEYIENFTPEDLIVPGNSKVILTEPKFVEKLSVLLQKTPSRVVRNYILMRAVVDMAPYLSDDIRTLDLEIAKAVSGRAEQVPRHKLCLQALSSKFLKVESALYVQNYFDKYSKSVATEMVDYIRNQFARQLNETSWSREDKRNAIEKIDALYAHVAYPNELLDNKILDSIYSKLNLDEEDYLRNSLALERFDYDFNLARVFEPVNKTSWIDFSESAVVNAFYKVETNAIILPAAVLQGVYFNAMRPKYVNFGAMGQVIGHEMSHGFDNIGHLFDKDGGLKNWWSVVAEADFEEKKRCIVEQYGNYTVFDGQHLNGKLTVGENLADFGGLKTAYLSYQNWKSMNVEEPQLPGLQRYTNNQIFWIASANIWCNNERPESIINHLETETHPPNDFRVNGPLRNLEMFAKDFECDSGTWMNPVEKCQPW